MSEPIETRALLALYRNHPSTSPSDRYGWRARLAAHERRAMLLDWAATVSDYGLLGCRNLGKASLAWIRANQRPVERPVISEEELAEALRQVSDDMPGELIVAYRLSDTTVEDVAAAILRRIRETRGG